jgi:DNA-binding transcriptional LysR family regulator
MELRQLEYVRAVVRAGSVTRAASEAHVSQPSVSKQIKLLEQELGVALFHRVGRRVVATEAGILLAECADRVFDDLTVTTDALAQLASSYRGSLRLCATETVTDNRLPPALAELRRLRPGVHITVEMLGTDDAIEQVLADEVDLAIVVLPIADSRLDIHPLFEEEILLAVPADHPWAKRDSVPLAEALADLNLLLSMPGHGLRGQIEREAQALGLRLEGRLDLRSQRALLGMVACSAGICFAPRISAREFGGRLAALALAPRLTRQIGWIARRGRRVPPVAGLLIELLKTGPTENQFRQAGGPT